MRGESEPSILARIRREFEFARHVPLRRLWRRLHLTMKRRVMDIFPPRFDDARPPRSMSISSPLFERSASGLLRDDAEFLVFSFLGVEARTPRARIDWRVGQGQLWRMNLHYMEYLESVDDLLFVDLTSQWIAANGSLARGAWRDSWNSYAVSLRVAVWLRELARRPQMDETARRLLETSATHQLLFLKQNLETDIGGNHLIKNILALILGAAYFSGPAAERWRSLGLSLLNDELSAQFLADGGHFERAPSYQCQVFADLLECRHALGSDPLSRRLDDALHGLAQCVADLAHPDGGVAQFGDSGLSMALRPDVCLDGYERLFGARPEARKIFAFPETGYFGARRGADFFVIDCGRVAADDLPAHGHADILSFELSIDGLRFIVDQGVYEYVAGARRTQSRASASHNTLSLDGVDQADFYGAFRCGRRPNVTVRRFNAHADGFELEGSHDGFSLLRGKPAHVRRVAISAGEIMLEDRVEGWTDRRAKIGFLLHPEVETESAPSHVVLSRGAARLMVTSSSGFAIENAVWWPDMGAERRTRRLVLASQTPGEPCRVIFRKRS